MTRKAAIIGGGVIGRFGFILRRLFDVHGEREDAQDHDQSRESPAKEGVGASQGEDAPKQQREGNRDPEFPSGKQFDHGHLMGSGGNSCNSFLY